MAERHPLCEKWLGISDGPWNAIRNVKLTEYVNRPDGRTVRVGDCLCRGCTAQRLAGALLPYASWLGVDRQQLAGEIAEWSGLATPAAPADRPAPGTTSPARTAPGHPRAATAAGSQTERRTGRRRASPEPSP